MTSLNREDWLKMVLWAANGKPLSPVQLQKTLFLLGKTAPHVVGDEYYEFIPYNYGPFDADIYADAEQLQWQGLVSIDAPAGQRWKSYSLTQTGAEKAEVLAGTLPVEAKDYLAKLVQWVLRLDFRTLLQYIYSKYPTYRANSVFQG